MTDRAVEELQVTIAMRLAPWALDQRADEHRRMARRVEALGKDAATAADRAVKANVPGSRQAITEHKSEAAAYREVWRMLTAEAQALEQEALQVRQAAERREADL